MLVLVVLLAIGAAGSAALMLMSGFVLVLVILLTVCAAAVALVPVRVSCARWGWPSASAIGPHIARSTPSQPNARKAVQHYVESMSSSSCSCWLTSVQGHQSEEAAGDALHTVCHGRRRPAFGQLVRVRGQPATGGQARTQQPGKKGSAPAAMRLGKAG